MFICFWDDIYSLNEVFYYFEKYFWNYGPYLDRKFEQIWVPSVFGHNWPTKHSDNKNLHSVNF